MRASLSLPVLAALVFFASATSSSDNTPRGRVAARAQLPTPCTEAKKSLAKLKHHDPRAQLSDVGGDLKVANALSPVRNARRSQPSQGSNGQGQDGNSQGQGQNSQGQGQNSQRARRSEEEQNVFGNAATDVSNFISVNEEGRGDPCPVPLSACPVRDAHDTEAFECVDLWADLSSCGGCAAEDISYDCTAIPQARNVECFSGRCKVHSCSAGYAVTAPQDACVRVVRDRGTAT